MRGVFPQTYIINYSEKEIYCFHTTSPYLQETIIQHMRSYPVFMNLTKCRVLVLGAGNVGLRKIYGLVDCDPLEILVLDPDSSREQLLPNASCICFSCRSFVPSDLDGRALVFAASADRSLNMQVATLCRRLSIPCNVVDMPDEGSFHVPAQFSHQDINIAFSTGGGSPALARHMAQDTAKRYAPMLAFMAHLRPLVLTMNEGNEVHATLFRSLVESELGIILYKLTCSSDTNEKILLYEQAKKLVLSLLPSKLHKNVVGLLQNMSA